MSNQFLCSNCKEVLTPREKDFIICSKCGEPNWVNESNSNSTPYTKDYYNHFIKFESKEK